MDSTCVYHHKGKKEDFQEAIELQNRIKTVEKEINALKGKIRKEKQFKYKVELNKQLHILQVKLESLKGKI